MKLRNEVRQMRDDKKQLTQQAQVAQAKAQQAQTQVQAVQAQAQQAAQAQALAVQQHALAACINNLRQIDGAKQQWALENRKDVNAVPAVKDIAAYLKEGVKCPAGGTYTLNSVGVGPTCTTPGHALPR
jgi:hypothetical protein